MTRSIRWPTRCVLTVATVPMLFGIAACGDDDGAAVRKTGESGSGSGASAVACVPVGDPADAATTVTVDLDEWKISPAEDSIPAGIVAFEAVNKGKVPHELVVIKGVAPDDLPETADGALDEDKLPDGALIGEIEGFPDGETCTGVFELAAGDYTLACNITENEGKKEIHLGNGMVTSFTVE